MTRVLVVDDDAGIRSIVAELLEDEGYTVDTADDGAQALQRAREAPPAAILLDLMMPVLDGWGFVGACRQQGICVGVPVGRQVTVWVVVRPPLQGMVIWAERGCVDCTVTVTSWMASRRRRFRS